MHAIEARESRNAVSAALLMHGLLVAGLFISLNWSRDTAKPVQAELWSGLPRNLPPSTIVPPQPTVQPTPAPPPPAPEEKADIAVQKKAVDTPKKIEPPKKAEPSRAELRKALEEKIRKENEARAKEKEFRDRQLAALTGRDASAKAEVKSNAPVTRAGIAVGADDGQKTGADADYRAQIASRIKLNITHREIKQGNPEAVVEIEQFPTGEIRKKTLLRSSGIPSYDQAVLAAIDKSSPLPKKKDGSVEKTLTLRFRPND